jgi:hypothetical protein
MQSYKIVFVGVQQTKFTILLILIPVYFQYDKQEAELYFNIIDISLSSELTNNSLL